MNIRHIDGDVAAGQKAQSKLTDLMRAETELRAFTEHLADPERWLARLRLLNPKVDPVAAIKQLRESRDKAMQAYETTRRATAKMKLPSQYKASRTWEWFRNHGIDVATEKCPVVEGITQTRFAIVESIIDMPRDGDTDFEYNATFFDPSSRSYQSLMFEHWIQDHTSLIAVDSPDSMWVISHFGYEFPPAPCDGTLAYNGQVRLVVSASINADSSGTLLVDLMLQEQPQGGTPPLTVEAYASRVAQQVFTYTTWKNELFTVSGSIPVAAGNRSRLWFGVGTYCAAEDGVAGTNGKAYLMVLPPPGQVTPGIHYHMGGV